MTTPAKIAANQANARHSTGPTTPEGKARAAQNALKHGLTAEQILIPGEDAEAFADLRDEYFEDLCPVGSREVACVDDIIAISWRLRRIPWIESGAIRFLMKLEPDLGASLFKFDKRDFITQRLPFYAAAWTNLLERALARLNGLQSSRKQAEARELELPAGNGAPLLRAVVEGGGSRPVTRLSAQGPQDEAAAETVEPSPAGDPAAPEDRETVAFEL